MNRRDSIRICSLLTLGATMGIAMAKDDGKIGKLAPAAFDKINEDAGTKLKAIKPDSAKLSADDEKFLGEIAMGGMFQLESSKLVADKGMGEEVKAYAKAEVTEQTGLGEKLKELATAKGATLPNGMSDEAAKTIEKLKALSGAEFDAFYLKNTGIKGHEMLKKTMTKVHSKTKDATLKSIAATALPLIETHLTVATDELAMSK